MTVKDCLGADTGRHTFVGKGRTRRIVPINAWTAIYVQLRIAYSGEYSQVSKPYPCDI